MTITLEPELEEAIDREAQRQGTSAEELALQTLRRDYLPAAPPEETLYDFLQGFIGVIDSSESVPGGANLSERTGEKFTEILLEKQAEERKRYAQWLKEQKTPETIQP